MNRRLVIGGLAAGAATIGTAGLIKSAVNANMNAWTQARPESAISHGAPSGMRYRSLGKTGINVSEVAFGAWGIGGKAYGQVERKESLNALARAEELGCNFVDTASVYGDSEAILGEFLRGRRHKWLVSTKYSGQEAGLESTLESQLRTMNLDSVDLYMIHWVPSESNDPLYEALHRIKEAGKARFVGVSLYAIDEIRRVLVEGRVDAFMVAFSLLDPDPFLAKLKVIREKEVGVLVRSSLKEGFLTGKYSRDAKFPDPRDQRHKWSPEQIAATVDAAEQFRFVEEDVGSMLVGAACYPLCFSETSTVILGTKSVRHADTNFGVVPSARLSPRTLERIQSTQRRMNLYDRKGRLLDAIRGVIS
jgi:aryl-alcohol dehydrogenase-like predicted oxidoreductase